MFAEKRMNTVGRLARQCLRVPLFSSQILANSPAHFSSLSAVKQPSALLAPVRLEVVQVASLKHVGQPKKRCKHCYFIVQDEVKYVMCTVHARHHQAGKQIAAKEGNMIMTHATQGSSGAKVNYGRGSRYMKTQESFKMEF